MFPDEYAAKASFQAATAHQTSLRSYKGLAKYILSPDAGGSTIHSLYRARLGITTSCPSFWENLRGGPASIHSVDQLIRYEEVPPSRYVRNVRRSSRIINVYASFVLRRVMQAKSFAAPNFTRCSADLFSLTACLERRSPSLSQCMSGALYSVRC